MKSLNAAKHPEIGKTSYGTIKTLESLPNNTNTIVTSDISLFPGLWEIELQLNGFESTGSKWILIQAVPYGTIAIVNGMNLYGERLTVPYLSNYDFAVHGEILNYGGANSYTPHWSDYFKATLLG